MAWSRPAEAATCTSKNLRYAATSNIIYVTGPVTCRLTDLKTLLPTAPLTLVNPTGAIWFLKANVKLEQGATLPLHGTSAGGDVNELRLKSNNTATLNNIVWIRAQWGTIDMNATKVKSWNEGSAAPDTETTTYKRAFIHVVSSLDADGVTPRQSRMDIRGSDVGYLGYNGAEAYGLAWKVRGTGADLYEKVNVYGTVTDSRIHHNYFGAYTFGGESMVWRGNQIDNNAQYGLDPHDDSDRLVIEGNDVHHNGNHGIICSQRCDHLTIRNNTSRDNKGNGIMLHRNTNDSLVEGNSTLRNADSGIALFESHRNTIRNNTIRQNNRGIRFSVGSMENVIEDNNIGNNTTFGLYFYKGTDLPASGDGRPKRNRFSGNDIHENVAGTMRLADADENVFTGNTFRLNGSTFLLERGTKNRFDGNTLADVAPITMKGDSAIRPVTTFTEHPRVAIKLDSYSTAVFEDADGDVFDPEETNLATTVTPEKASLTLTAANTGGSSVVLTRALRVRPPEATVKVNPTLWQTDGERWKEWKLVSPAASDAIAYTVADLAADTLVTVRQNGEAFLSLTTDETGTIQFTDTPDATSTVTYTVRPGGSAL